MGVMDIAVTVLLSSTRMMSVLVVHVFVVWVTPLLHVMVMVMVNMVTTMVLC